jgi:hypothetical protein
MCIYDKVLAWYGFKLENVKYRFVGVFGATRKRSRAAQDGGGALSRVAQDKEVGLSRAGRPAQEHDRACLELDAQLKKTMDPVSSWGVCSRQGWGHFSSCSRWGSWHVLSGSRVWF